MTPAAATSPALAAHHKAAWIALGRAHAALVGRIQEALTSAGLPPYQWFELLANIDDSEGGRMTMGELAEALIMTRGGLTKLFDRLEAAGLVSRAACPTDRRAVYAVIETPGRKLLDEMRPIVVGELDAAFGQQISREEAETIAEALERSRNGACAGMIKD